MEAHAPAIDGGAFVRRKSHRAAPLTAVTVSADADTLRLERENSSLLDEQVLCALAAPVFLPHVLQQIARETMLALLDASDTEPLVASASKPQARPSHCGSESHPSAFQKSSVYDEFGNDELEYLRQTVADLQQQVAVLKSELQKQRCS